MQSRNCTENFFRPTLVDSSTIQIEFMSMCKVQISNKWRKKSETIPHPTADFNFQSSISFPDLCTSSSVQVQRLNKWAMRCNWNSTFHFFCALQIQFLFIMFSHECQTLLERIIPHVAVDLNDSISYWTEAKREWLQFIMR